MLLYNRDFSRGSSLLACLLLLGVLLLELPQVGMSLRMPPRQTLQRLVRDGLLSRKQMIGSAFVFSVVERTRIDFSALNLDRSYYAVIKVGDINFRVVLDTGSSDLWLVSSACETEACKSVPRYPLNYQSPSFQSVNGNATAFSASYADGTGVSLFSLLRFGVRVVIGIGDAQWYRASWRRRK